VPELGEIDRPVRLSVLGPLRVTVNGAPADVGGRRQRSVLTRLAVAGGAVVSAHALVEDLWPGDPPQRALAALQVQISHLRRVLEPDRRPRSPAAVLVSAAPGYALALDRVAVDSARFVGLVEQASGGEPQEAAALLTEALQLWSGPPFGEFTDDPWAAPEAARLTELRLVAVERLAEARLAVGAAHTAVPDLERLVHDHPFRESAVHLLAVALYRSGRQADALAVLARVRTRLADELGVDPGPQLRAAEREILAQADPGPVRPEVTAPPPRSVHRPVVEPLLGRDDELARVRAVAAAVAATATARMVLVGGEPGAGKTVFVDAVRAALAAEGWTVALGRCPEVDGAPPGWAWREIATAFPAEDERLRPLLRPGGPAAAQETFWAAQALVERLRGVAAAGPLLLVLDDLHRADGESLQLLRSVITGLAQVPVLVVATVRPAEVGPDLDTALAALAGPITDRVELSGLAPAAVAALLDRHGAGRADPAVVALVGERTGGNPLFVRELARLIATDGAGAAAVAVPAGVRDVLRRRLDRLPANARAVLRRAAVLGRDVAVDALVALGEPDAEDAILDAVELGIVSGLLVDPGEDRVRFAHALVRDTLYGDVPPLRRRRMHAAALAALAGGAGADPAELAHHALAAGAAVPPAQALPPVVAAARAAVRSGAPREAAHLWEAAVRLAGPAGVEPDREMELRCAHVSALAHAGAVRAAMQARDAAIDRARGDAQLVAALTSFDAPAPWTIRVDARLVERRVALLQQQVRSCTDPRTRSRLLAMLVLETESAADDVAASAADEVMEVSAGLDPATRAIALNARGFTVNGPDRRAELAAVGRELAELADLARLPGYRALAHHYEFMVAAEHLRFAEAQQHADAAVAVAPGGQLGFTLGWSAIYQALRALIEGDAEGAERLYTAVGERMTAAGEANGATAGLIGRIAARHARGRHGELADAVLSSPASAVPAFQDLVAAVLVAAGRTAEAARVWRPDLDPPRTYYWHLWMVARSEAAIGLGHRAVAAHCYTELMPWAATLAGVSSGSITFGPVAATLAELARFLGRPEAERTAHLRTALELARRVGQPDWIAAAEQASASGSTGARRAGPIEG